MLREKTSSQFLEEEGISAPPSPPRAAGTVCVPPRAIRAGGSRLGAAWRPSKTPGGGFGGRNGAARGGMGPVPGSHPAWAVPGSPHGEWKHTRRVIKWKILLRRKKSGHLLANYL